MSDIQINHPVNPAPADVPTWTTDEFRAEFEAIGFGSPFVSVKRLSDGVKGTMEFTGGGGTPRVYFNFQEA